MKVCMRCGLLQWDQNEYCIICEKKLAPYKEPPKSYQTNYDRLKKFELERAMDKYKREKEK